MIGEACLGGRLCMDWIGRMEVAVCVECVILVPRRGVAAVVGGPASFL